MSQNVTQIQVFVSCPGDVEEEKGIVKTVCAALNNGFAEEYSIQFLVKDWKDIVGEFGERPQEIINRRFSKYDIYLGILWMRFGTPPGASNKYTGEEFNSGTEEEFYIAFDRWKKNTDDITIYAFFKQPVVPMSTMAAEQLLKVFKFKDTLMSHGWINIFPDKEAFQTTIWKILLETIKSVWHRRQSELKTVTLTENSIATSTESNHGGAFIHQNLTESLVKVYIERYFRSSALNGNNSNQDFKDQDQNLEELVIENRQVVVLGNGGSGKSEELRRVARIMEEPNAPFIPVYKTFKTYVDEDIEDFLPDGWKEVNEDLLLILLDGMDEILPQHFLTATRKIGRFAERHPNHRIVVSCRTNFYEIPSLSSSGTLPGFSCFYLKDLSLTDVKRAAEQNGLNGTSLVRTCYDNGLADMVNNPFFLDILFNYFKLNGDLNINRAHIFKSFIYSRIASDKEHFKTTISDEEKRRITTLLENVALVMETTGRNFITTADLCRFLTDHDVTLIKYFSSFYKSPHPEVWRFEHNNIQEYLAAAALSRKNINDIQQIITFPPKHLMVKPTWVNTLSFLAVTGATDLVNQLFNWLIANEPELIVKFEKDRISRENRNNLFFKIFNDYREKGIWLRSNKFSNSELALFGQSDEIIKFLLNELADVANDRIIRMNAIHLLDEMYLPDFPVPTLDRMKAISLHIIESENSDGSFLYSLLGAMSALGLDDKTTLERVVDVLGKRANQYIRAGLFKLLGSSGFADDYVDIFARGTYLSDEDLPDREDINLGDESWRLKEAIIQLSSPIAIRKILQLFEDPLHSRNIVYYNREEIVTKMVDKAIEAFSADATLYDFFIVFFENTVKKYDKYAASQAARFFASTGTSLKAFNTTWWNQDISDYDKEMMVSFLLTNEVVDYLIDSYKQNVLSENDLLAIRQDVHWFRQNMSIDKKVTDYLDIQIKSRTGIVIIDADKAALENERLKKSQRNFDLLFSKNAFIDEVKNIFTHFDDKPITYAQLWELYKEGKMLDDYFPSAVVTLIRELTPTDENVTLHIVLEFINDDEKFTQFQIFEIYQELKGNHTLVISSSQSLYLSNWAIVASKTINWEKAITIRNGDTDSFSVNENAQLVWFFFIKLSIAFDEGTLLDFTLFRDIHNFNSRNGFEEIAKIKSLVDINKLHSKIRNNLQLENLATIVWKSNASFAIENNLAENFELIFQHINSNTLSDNDRIDVLKTLFSRSLNFSRLRELLKANVSWFFKWNVVSLLLPYKDQKSYLSNFLNDILTDKFALHENKLQAAKYLIQLDLLPGLIFYTDFLVGQENVDFSLNDVNLFSNLKDEKSIPHLLVLLHLCLQPKYRLNKFNSLESMVQNGLQSVAQNSEESLWNVTDSLRDFILKFESELPSVKFLYMMIDRLNEQFYLNKSSSYSVEEAIEILQLSTKVS